MYIHVYTCIECYVILIQLCVVFSGHLDMVVIGAGTGGTVTGIGRKMKDKLPHVQVSKFRI